MCDCEWRVHPGVKCGAVGCNCHKEHNRMKVPIKFDGFVVGTAEISPDGMVISAELDSSIVGKEIRDVLLHGLADSISIRPNYIPMHKEE